MKKLMTRESITVSNKANERAEILPATFESRVNLFKELYSYPINTDVIIRSLFISGLEKEATLLFIDTVTNTEVIEKVIIEALVNNLDETKTFKDIIPSKTVITSSQLKEIIQKINNGYLALFVADETDVYLIDCAKFKERSIERSENEIVIKGPKETFVEGVETNFSLIRKKIKNENLIFESIKISERSNDEVYIIYIKNLTNETLLANLRERLNNIEIDTVQNLAILEQYIEDRPKSVFPTILYTERPDRVSTFLEKGNIALLMNNSSDALVVPITFWDLFQSAEDEYLRYINGNFTKILRFAALLITLFVSSIYVSVTTFHPEMIPTDLLLSISATRSQVPFTPLIEILLMEIAFELIREAGLKVPLPIGPTIGIVGALILGQAAVDANIVSPIVVIVVALSALSSFVVNDIGLNFSVRFLRFFIIIAAFLFGFYGVVAIFMVGFIYLISITSFGVPYFLPITPSYQKSSEDAVSKKLVTSRKMRPTYLYPKDKTRN